MIGAVVLITIAASSLLLANALRTQRQAGDEIRQRFENVLILKQTQSLVVDAETGQRGFLLTSNPNFLEPYDRARAQLPGQLRSLVNARIDAPDDQLQSLMSKKLQELAWTLQLANTGHRDEALAVVNSGSGKAYMDAIRADIGRLSRQQEMQINAAIERSVRYTVQTYLALVLLVVSALALLGLGLSTMLRSQRLEAEAVRLRQVEQAERRTALIARELNHRVKNLFSVVLAIVQLAGRGATTPKEAVTRVRDRVQALARAHDVSLGTDPMGGFELQELLRVTLAPYVSQSAELDLAGPPIHLPVMRATPLGLIIHELATNAIKHGAWSQDGGRVAVTWSVTDPEKMLRLDWSESRTNPLELDGTGGFGSQLITAAVAQLDGSLTRERGSNGLRILIEAPILAAQSDAQEQTDGH
jgi:two-component sensor histidine kinase/CHASE3 domain sensor protein